MSHAGTGGFPEQTSFKLLNVFFSQRMLSLQKKKNETDVFGIVFRSFVANGRKWEELILWNYFFLLRKDNLLAAEVRQT